GLAPPGSGTRRLPPRRRGTAPRRSGGSEFPRQSPRCAARPAPIDRSSARVRERQCRRRWPWAALWHQLITARFGDQDGRAGGVFLDLLPQPVDVRLEGVRRHAGIVPPNFLQQRLARYRALAGAIKVSQNGSLLFGETHLIALGVEQNLRAWPERVGTNGKDGGFARLLLAQLHEDESEQHGKTEGLVHVVVGARLESQDGVGVGVVPGQHDDRRLEAVLAQDAYGFPPVDVREPDIHDHEVDLTSLGGLYPL